MSQIRRRGRMGRSEEEERRVLVVPIPFRYRTQTIMRQVASSARGREKKKESKKGTEEKNIYMRED